jgi:glycosyltransferase involved in cell wall biosynthesis
MKKNHVSVILPTCNRYHVCLENIENIIKTQSFKYYEILVCDDSDKEYYTKESETFKEALKKFNNVRYFYCARFDIDGNKDYGIARARNFGVINAECEFLVFLDDRITTDSQLLYVFFNLLRDNYDAKIWFFGDKGANKTTFVENCSAIKRSHLVDLGMFCERIDKYGGMTRELLARFQAAGFQFQYVPAALAKQVCKSGGWDKKEIEIPEMKALLKKIRER